MTKARNISNDETVDVDYYLRLARIVSQQQPEWSIWRCIESVMIGMSSESKLRVSDAHYQDLQSVKTEHISGEKGDA